MLAVCCLLGGCSGQSKQMQEVLAFRAMLLGGGGCSFQAEVEAQYDAYHSTFLLQCQYDAAADTLDFTVLEPESIAGITGQIAQDRRTLSFSDLALEMELLAEETVSPVALPQIISQSWAKSYIASAGTDRDYLVAVFQNGYEDDTIKIETWFEQGLPVWADVWYEGDCQASVRITEFTVQK